jgi:lysophospholipase L1-like esterase
MMTPTLTLTAGGEGGIPGPRGPAGADGKSAYEIAVAEGFVGDEAAWLASLKGADGAPGQDGADGKSAYEIAVDNGFVGDELDWLASLKGEKGDPASAGAGGEGTPGADGKSAYEIAVENGFVGDEVEWLESLKGADGAPGQDGSDFAVQYDNSTVDLGPVRMAWGSADSILGTPEEFVFPAPFAAPPVVQITRQSPGSVLVPSAVTTGGFTIHRGEVLPNPIPFSWQATGLKPDEAVIPPSVFDIPGLPIWSAAVRAQRAGKRHARIMCIGDSTTMGYGANGATVVNNDRAGSYPTHLSGILTDRGSKGSWQNVVGNGNVPSELLSFQKYDARSVWGPQWGPSSVRTAGGFTHRNGAGTPGPLVFTPTEPWDTAEVYLYQGEPTATQSLKVLINSTEKASVTTHFWETTSGNLKRIIVKADTVGMHTLSLTPAVSGVIHVVGWLTYNDAEKEISVLNAGWGGATAAAWNEGTQQLAPIPVIKSLNPDLAIINLGINDGTPVDPLLSKDQFKSQIQNLIDAARSSGADVMLVAPNDGYPVDFGQRYGVLGTALQEMAAEQSLAFLDLRTVMGTWAQANTAGLMRDAVHPNSAGYAVIAEAIADVIMPLGA